MGFFNKYPYTDNHELNLDWIISKVKEVVQRMEDFERNLKITYADPIQWDITTQYPENTIVLFNLKAYMSKRPVNGQNITDGDYWQLIYDFSRFTDDMINVKNCGAVGDGVTDDTVAINQALEIGAGKTIYFPAGTYLTSGIEITQGTALIGFNMSSTTIKLIDGSTSHLITGGDFDVNADGVSKSTPLGAYSCSIQDITLDGNKANCPSGKGGIMIYGFNIQLLNVVVHDCNTYGVYLEAPGSVFSLDVGTNLQNDLMNMTIYSCNSGELVYNGQSDSNLYNILCYGSNEAVGYTHALFGSKSNGTRVFGMHCWGDCEYSCHNKGVRVYLNNCHFESARTAQLYTETPVTFTGNVYINGPVNDSCGVLVNGAQANTEILDFRCNGIKTPVKLGTYQGGHHFIKYEAYYGGNDGVLFDGAYDSTFTIDAMMWGNTNKELRVNRYETASSTVNERIIQDGVNYKVRSKGQSVASFGVEHSSANVVAYVATFGGTASNPVATLVARGTPEDIDLKLQPQGAGCVKFGNVVTEAVTADATILIHTNDGHVVKLLGKVVS